MDATVPAGHLVVFLSVEVSMRARNRINTRHEEGGFLFWRNWSECGGVCSVFGNVDQWEKHWTQQNEKQIISTT